MRMYLTNETLTSTGALGVGLVNEVCLGDIEATRLRAVDIARWLSNEPECCSVLVYARHTIDFQRVAAEAVGHASCLEANGGVYADSSLPHAGWAFAWAFFHLEKF